MVMDASSSTKSSSVSAPNVSTAPTDCEIRARLSAVRC